MTTLKQKLQQGPVYGAFMKGSDPAIAELLGTTGLDFFVLDNEHVALDKENITNILRAAELYNITPIVRVMFNEASNILQALDAGAAGVQVPNIDTAEQAQALQQYSKYVPMGKRGFSPAVRAGRYGTTPIKQYIEESNANGLVIAHCESVEGHKNIEEICKVEAIDVIFIGPMDMSQSMGIVGEMGNPALKEVIEDVTKKALAAGKQVGIVCAAKDVAYYQSIGMRYLLIGNDQSAITGFFKGALKTISEVK